MSRIPGHVVDGKSPPFPQGKYAGDLVDVKNEWSEDLANLNITLTFKNNTPLNGAPTVGARPFMERISVIANKQSVVDVVDFDSAPYGLRLAAGKLTQIAVAFGAPVTVMPDKSVDVDLNGFLTALTANAYQGKRTGFEVVHRAWKSKKTGKEGVSAEGIAYFPVEGGTNITMGDASSADAIPAVGGLRASA